MDSNGNNDLFYGLLDTHSLSADQIIELLNEYIKYILNHLLDVAYLLHKISSTFTSLIQLIYYQVNGIEIHLHNKLLNN